MYSPMHNHLFLVVLYYSFLLSKCDFAYGIFDCFRSRSRQQLRKDVNFSIGVIRRLTFIQIIFKINPKVVDMNVHIS